MKIAAKLTVQRRVASTSAEFARFLIASSASFRMCKWFSSNSSSAVTPLEFLTSHRRGWTWDFTRYKNDHELENYQNTNAGKNHHLFNTYHIKSSRKLTRRSSTHKLIMSIDEILQSCG